MRLLFTLYSTFCFIIVHCQSYFHEGFVLDESNHPIPFTTVHFLETSTITDSLGYFRIQCDSQQCLLEIRRIGYQKKLFESSFNTKSQIILQSKILSEIRIYADLERKIERKKNEQLLDFAFIQSQLILLTKTKSEYNLSLIRGNLRTSFLSFSKKQFGIRNDNTGHLYLESKNHFSEINVNTQNELQLKAPKLKDSFTEFIENLVSINENSAIWTFSYLNSQENTLVKTDNFTEESRVLYSSINSNRKEFITYTQTQIDNNPGIHMMGEIYPGAEGRYNSDLAFDKVEDSLWLATIVLKPSYNPVYNLNDSIYFFNHNESKAIVFDCEGNQIRQIEINYHLDPKWAKRILIDSYSSKFYTLSIDNGIYILNELNMNSGKIDKQFRIEKYPFPVNLKVNNNFAYFFYKNSNSDIRYELMKINIKR
ncbi:MAG: hypothetical protein ABJG68_14670 [Crocinitomicaceae bacterium]